MLMPKVLEIRRDENASLIAMGRDKGWIRTKPETEFKEGFNVACDILLPKIQNVIKAHSKTDDALTEEIKKAYSEVRMAIEDIQTFLK